jgi:hypothetical protein
MKTFLRRTGLVLKLMNQVGIKTFCSMNKTMFFLLAPCTKKISLTAIPLSKNIVFGKDDIDEMLFMLQVSNLNYSVFM